MPRKKKTSGNIIEDLVIQYKLPTNCRYSFINKLNEKLQKKTYSGLNSLHEKIFLTNPNIENNNIARLVLLYSFDQIFDAIRLNEFENITKFISEYKDDILKNSIDKAKKLYQKYDYLYVVRENVENNKRSRTSRENTNKKKTKKVTATKKSKKRKQKIYNKQVVVDSLKKQITSVSSTKLRSVVKCLIENPELINEHYNKATTIVARKTGLKENTARTYFYKAKSMIGGV